MSERAPVSPCVGVCTLDAATGLCRGCRRSIDEIAAWPRLSPSEKRDILERLAGRTVTPQGSHAATATRSA